MRLLNPGDIFEVLMKFSKHNAQRESCQEHKLHTKKNNQT